MALTTLFALAGALVVGQGEAVQLTLPETADVEAAWASWDGREVPFVARDEGWLTVIGVDLDTPAQGYDIPVRLEFRDASARHLSIRLEVKARDFPTTELTVEPRYVELDADDQARAARESREIGAIYATLTPEPYWTEAFGTPLQGATGGRNFGHRRVFNGQARAPHSGADLRAATGTPILASNRGRVVLAKELFFSGNAVFLDHGLGVYSAYLHLSEIGVELGSMVEKGQTVGLAGATGRVTGPHLHWGARILDARVDPFTLLELGEN